ncbi:MAG: hypothetical protein AB8B51_10760, partial [Sedimentitalea sp.]
VPQGAFAQAQARALCAYLCATVHVAFAHIKRGRRWADGDDTLHDMRGVAARNLRDCAALLESQLALDPWALGKVYSFCDPYLFLLDRWLAAGDVSLADYPKLAAHHRTMQARPATQTALALHGLMGAADGA